MDQTSQTKVMQAGFRILRCQDEPKPIIKVKQAGAREWHTLEKFDTKVARDRRFKELLQNEKTIQD